MQYADVLEKAAAFFFLIRLKNFCLKTSKIIFSFTPISAEVTTPMAGETENCILNRTIFATKCKGSWLNFVLLQFQSLIFWQFGEGQEFNT